DDSRRNYAGIKSAQSPGGRTIILGINLALEIGPIDVERRARSARLRDLEHSRTGPNLLSHAEQAPIQPADSQIPAKGPGKYRIAASDQLLDALEGDDEDSLIGTAMNLGVRVRIPFESKRSDRAFRNGKLGNASAGDGDLDNSAGNS